MSTSKLGFVLAFGWFDEYMSHELWPSLMVSVIEEVNFFKVEETGLSFGLFL